MSIGFDSAPGKKFAIRPFIGGINGISGVSLFNHDVSPRTAQDQDYVVQPNQERLDDIALQPVVVRQFVATPLVPHSDSIRLQRTPPKSGRNSKKVPDEHFDETLAPVGGTVEWQMTGKDSVGSIQLQIIPQFDVSRIHAGNSKDVIPNSRRANIIPQSDDGTEASEVQLVCYQDPPPSAVYSMF